MRDEVVRRPHLLGPREQGAPVAAGARQADGDQDAQFGEVLIPTESVLEMVKGQRRTTTRKFYPGLHVRPDGAQRGDLPPRQEHAQDHRLPRRHQPDAGARDGDRRRSTRR